MVLKAVQAASYLVAHGPPATAASLRGEFCDAVGALRSFRYLKVI